MPPTNDPVPAMLQPPQNPRTRSPSCSTRCLCPAPAVALAALAAISAMAGCASPVPAGIRTPAPRPLTVQAARQAPEEHIGERVRWGGSILEVINLPDSTEIEVLARPLRDGGEPVADADAQGRFIVRVGRFVDPAEYPRDRLLTAAGVLSETLTRDVGRYPYLYPVLSASTLYLWPEQEPEIYPYGTFGYYGYGPWYRPWYGPWRPWYDPWYGPW